MSWFPVPLLAGFACNLASAFTGAFCRRWGAKRGRLAVALLRNVFGIPVWAAGLALAASEPSPQLFAPALLVTLLAWLVVILGALLILAALRSIGRLAALPSAGDALVEGGPYRWVRHPIHTGTLLEFAGLALLIPTPAFLLACALGVAWVLLQTRFEEIDLLQRIPAYRDYMRRVPSFFPRWRSTAVRRG